MRAYRVAYDGTGYRGFQRQPHGETVEDALFAGLEDLDVPLDGAPPGYTAAGRTDAGVSARAQTVAFEAPEWLSPTAWNGALPEDIRAWAAADVTTGFHATHDAKRRRYRYYLHAPDAALDAAQAACEGLSGRHDFHNLTPDGSGTTRTVHSTVTRDGEFLLVEATAAGFARQLVRRVVTVIDAVARGRRDGSFVDRALEPAPLPGPEGIPPAPPEPLVLLEVDYPAIEFDRDRSAAESAAGIFEDRRRRRLAGARVAEALAAVDAVE